LPPHPASPAPSTMTPEVHQLRMRNHHKGGSPKSQQSVSRQAAVLETAAQKRVQADATVAQERSRMANPIADWLNYDHAHEYAQRVETPVDAKHRIEAQMRDHAFQSFQHCHRPASRFAATRRSRKRSGHGQRRPASLPLLTPPKVPYDHRCAMEIERNISEISADKRFCGAHGSPRDMPSQSDLYVLTKARLQPKLANSTTRAAGRIAHWRRHGFGTTPFPIAPNRTPQRLNVANDHRGLTKAASKHNSSVVSVQSMECDHHDHPGGLASALMQAADRHSRDGRLSLVEMESFLQGPQFAGFLRWIKARLNSKPSNFKVFDRDGSGDLDITELETAVSAYKQERLLCGEDEDEVSDWETPPLLHQEGIVGLPTRDPIHGNWYPELPVKSPQEKVSRDGPQSEVWIRPHPIEKL